LRVGAGIADRVFSEEDPEAACRQGNQGVLML
jgi:hypothetical protein